MCGCFFITQAWEPVGVTKGGTGTFSNVDTNKRTSGTLLLAITAPRNVAMESWGWSLEDTRSIPSLCRPRGLAPRAVVLRRFAVDLKGPLRRDCPVADYWLRLVEDGQWRLIMVNNCSWLVVDDGWLWLMRKSTAGYRPHSWDRGEKTGVLQEPVLTYKGNNDQHFHLTVPAVPGQRIGGYMPAVILPLLIWVRHWWPFPMNMYVIDVRTWSKRTPPGCTSKPCIHITMGYRWTNIHTCRYVSQCTQVHMYTMRAYVTTWKYPQISTNFTECQVQGMEIYDGITDPRSTMQSWYVGTLHNWWWLAQPWCDFLGYQTIFHASCHLVAASGWNPPVK